MTTTVIDCPAAKHWPEMHRLVHRVVHDFVRIRGGHHDNYISIAHEAYVKAVRTWDENRGPLGKRVAFLVSRALMSEARRLARRSGRGETTFTDLQHDCAGVPDREYENPLAMLDGDAALAVEVAMQIVPQWQTSPKGAREMVVEILMELGWSARRVAEAFRQVQGALA